MKKDLSCFVIIGYGKKTSYATGEPRILNLDETYSRLIKPVFEEKGIDCYRAIDKNVYGSIDLLMLREIQKADIAIVDISTLNANVMWELGVRHALKKNHTIIMCEEVQMASIPFDINHMIIHSYAHSEESIPEAEVSRFQERLRKIIDYILNEEQAEIDSPVHLFLKTEEEGTPEMVKGPSFSEIMRSAEEAKNKKLYLNAYSLFEKAEVIARNNAALKEELNLIITRKALCTYKNNPSDIGSLEKAIEILQELNPEKSMDIEVLGLSGAIQKRLFEVTGNENNLDNAISFYKRGFKFQNDYYNGINAAFILYKKAAIEKEKDNDEWDDFKTEGDFHRNESLKIAKSIIENKSFTSDEAVWVYLTLAEAYHYKGMEEKAKEFEEKAFSLADLTGNDFARDSYNSQKEKIDAFYSLIKN